MTHGCLYSLGVLSKLNLVKPKELFTAQFPDFKITLSNDFSEIIAKLSDMFPKQKDGIIALFEFIKRLKLDVISPTMNPAFNIPSHDRVSLRFLDSSYQQILSEYIDDKALIAILSQMWHYIGLPPSHSAANFSACVNSSAFVEGEHSIIGGGSALVRALVERLRELGGEVYTGKQVEQILIKEGKVQGVKLVDGTQVLSKIVVGATDPVYLFDNLVSIEEISEIFRYRIRQMIPSLSMYVTYVGINCLPTKIGFGEGNYFYNFGLDADAAFENVLKHNIDSTDYCIHNGSAQGTSVAPQGCGILSFMELTPANDWLNMNDAEYKKTKESVGKSLFNKYSKQFPKLKDYIEVMEFLTPRTLASYTNNRDGAVYGFAQTIEQSNHKRLRIRTPVSGLFLTGAWTLAGGGYEGALVSGIQTAKAIMRENRFEFMAPEVRLHPEDTYEGYSIEDPAGNMSLLSLPPEHRVLPSSHYTYGFLVKVYGDELNSRGNADASAFLRYMDRARLEIIEEIDLGDLNWHAEYAIKVYRIEARFATITRMSDMLEVCTGIRRISNHRVSFDQRIINKTNGRIVCDAAVEVLFLGNNNQLMQVPPKLVSTDNEVPDFSSDRTEPLPFKEDEHFPFRTRFRVYFEDTDLQAVMFHVSYVRYCERAMFDLVQSIWPDVSTNVWMSRTNASVSRIDIRYLKAAVLGDRLEVRTTLVDMDTKRLCFGQRIINLKNSEVLADVVTDVEFRDGEGKSFLVPSQIADIAKAHLLEMERK
jgi:all-trans-retinol 13,14-reductase